MRLLALLLLVALAFGETVKVAASSSLRFALEELKELFKRETGHELLVSYGASGHFYLQIKNGAPYELFLSADERYAKLLVKEGKAERYAVFALGKLALFTVKDLPLTDYRVAASPLIKRLAVANPKYAPYGKAALEFLKNAGLYEQVKRKLVYGANAAQAFQFVVTGGADAGLLALPLVKAYGKGRYLVLPDGLYEPVRHAAVITAAGRNSRAARAFVEFLATQKARNILKKYGFETDVAGAEAEP
ncbi:MAG: molybdate ABC transporter substrate-binding protein [Aquificae bacterium]|nr:molybdate ABC transporter substrate-binding protein [Aquificota bacterium]